MAAKRYLDYFMRRKTLEIVRDIEQHSLKVRDTVEALRDAVDAFVSGDESAFSAAAERVKSLEEEADSMRRSISLKIARGEIDPRDASDLVALIRNVDYVGDEAKNAALTMEIMVERGMKIAGELGSSLRRMAKLLLEEVDVLALAVRTLFKDLDECHNLIEKVGVIEHEIDLEYHRAKSIIPEEMGVKALILLSDLISEIESSSDLAEDASDILDSLRVRFALPKGGSSI